MRVSVLVRPVPSSPLILLRGTLLTPLRCPQSDCLNNIVNAEKRGKRQVLVRPSSKVIVRFLTVMQKHGTLGAAREARRTRDSLVV